LIIRQALSRSQSGVFTSVWQTVRGRSLCLSPLGDTDPKQAAAWDGQTPAHSVGECSDIPRDSRRRTAPGTVDGALPATLR